jgi:hypothetical protein
MIDTADMLVEWRSLIRTPGAGMESSGVPEEGENTAELVTERDLNEKKQKIATDGNSTRGTFKGKKPPRRISNDTEIHSPVQSISAGPRQHSDSSFRVSRDSWPYFAVWRLWKLSYHGFGSTYTKTEDTRTVADSPLIGQ